MKVLLVGSGAREHAIAAALVRGGAELYGFLSARNPGIYPLCRKFVVGNASDPAAVAEFAASVRPELTVIGPDSPLAAGVVDPLLKRGIHCFGPTRALARLESSKSFARELLQNHRIPGNPEFRVFRPSSPVSEIHSFLNDLGEYVVKPDGLTGGKGVRVFGEHLRNHQEALDYCSEVFRHHGAVIIEEKLDGEEFSLQSITDGKAVVDCPAVQDHKRAFDGDTGPNTGGMGSYSNANHSLPFLDRSELEAAHGITVRVAAALRKEIGSYRGVMYGGFMATEDGVKLIEYNSRFGQPEAMNVIPLLKNNFVDVCSSAARAELSRLSVGFESKATVCKYAVPNGYPDKPVISKIDVPENLEEGVLRFFCSVEQRQDGIYTSTSRAVAFVGVADSIAAAEKLAEKAVSQVKGDVFHRRDIGTAALIRKRIEHMRRLRP